MLARLSAERVAYAHLRILGAVVVLLGALLASGVNAEIPAPRTYDDISTPEGWAWSQIKQGLPADFAHHCGATLDARTKEDSRWRDDPCRTIQASFIVDLLTTSPLRDSIPYKGVVLDNAKIVGDVDLEFATIDRPLRIEFSRFEGAMRLDYAHADSLVDFQHSVFAGPFEAIAFRTESDLVLPGVLFLRKAVLSSAKIKGHVEMTGANFNNDLGADALQVGGR